MSVEFEEKVMERFDKIDKFEEFEMKKLGQNDKFQKQAMKKFEESDKFQKQTMKKFEEITEKLNGLETKMDTIANVNIARILNEQTRHNIEQDKKHQEVISKIEEYENNNEKEHKEFRYEINSLKSYVINQR